MPVTRVFLDWTRPLCATVPEWLLEGAGPGTLDLRGTVVVVPTRQSSWRLHAALPLAAHGRGAALVGPEIVTARVLLEPPPRADRASVTQTVQAWCDVLREAADGEFDALLGKHRPGTTAAALRVARRLAALREELADGALSIGEVAARGMALEEPDRWKAMGELERRFLDRLEAWGLRDRVTDQLAHARAGEVAPGVSRIVLAAVPDPPRLLVSLLETWSGSGGEVSVLVAAPPADAASFDAWGRPLPQVWSEREIALADRDIVLAADPEDQAARIAEEMAASLDARPAADGRFRPDVAIGVPDREAIAPLQRELAALSLAAFDPQDRPFADTPLFHLVQSLLEWRERPGYAETAALLRHPDVLAAMPNPCEVLRQLDDFHPKHLPVTFADLCERVRQAAEAPQGATSPTDALAAALRRLEVWRGLLAGARLSAGLRETLGSLYAGRSVRPAESADAAFQQAVSVLDTALRELASVEGAGRAGSDAVPVLLERLRSGSLRAERAGEPLDLEGWLELAWNPAPTLCVAGMNEGLVPDGHLGDLFLPDSLRRQLGLRDDRLRVARDAYLLAALCAQRTGGGDGCGGSAPRVMLFVGKTSAAGDPLRPSRLLFRCPDERLVARARNLFCEAPSAHAAAAFDVSFKLDPERLPRAAGPTDAPLRLSATAFRDYLACPLRFYLLRVLKMRVSDDRAREPDGGAFGELVHDVLDAMAKDQGAIWACGDAARLAAWLEARLRALAITRYGAEPWLGVTLAVESAVRRLGAFADRQVAWHALGWEIVSSEFMPAPLELEGVAITGRVDRVDRNRNDGSACILDYKTTDRGGTPVQTHLGPARDTESMEEAVVSVEPVPALAPGARRSAKPRRWTDLQLPLYREMLREEYDGRPQVAYVLLPKTLADTQFAVWDPFDDALQEHAIRCARAVARSIRQGRFWPPTAQRLRYDDFGDLLFDNPKRSIAEPRNPWGSDAAASGREGNSSR